MQELLRAYREHDRSYRELKYVYPVVSRRAGGISIGINLSPHKKCNFDCLYCQVDRSTEGEKIELRTEDLHQELQIMLMLVESGQLFADPHFGDIPLSLREIKDIALSGDGEPTAENCFPEVCQLLADMRTRGEVGEAKFVVITNATRFHRPNVERGLEILMAHGGEIWGKLDAGTNAYYHLVDRSNVSLDRVLANLILASRRWPIVIQTLFCEIAHEGPSLAEREAYAQRLKDILAAGGQIKEVQLHTVARNPANHKVEALSKATLEAMAEEFRRKLPLKFNVIGGRAG